MLAGMLVKAVEVAVAGVKVDAPEAAVLEMEMLAWEVVELEGEMGMQTGVVRVMVVAVVVGEAVVLAGVGTGAEAQQVRVIMGAQAELVRVGSAS